MTPPPSQPGAPSEPGMSHVVYRNIRSLTDVRAQEESRRTLSDRIADRVTSFAGSMPFVFVHAALFGSWLLLNSPWVHLLPKWDPYPFVMLAMIASVEAIFLSTFILITQNRMQKLADRRAELDLQISLLTEHELTRVVRLLDDVARKIGVNSPANSDLDDAKRDVNPAKVVEAIESAEEKLGKGSPDAPPDSRPPAKEPHR